MNEIKDTAKFIYANWRRRFQPSYTRVSTKQEWVWDKLVNKIEDKDLIIWIWCVFNEYGCIMPNLLVGDLADKAWIKLRGNFWQSLYIEFDLQCRYINSIKTEKNLPELIAEDFRFDPLFKYNILRAYGFNFEAKIYQTGACVWLGSNPYYLHAYNLVPELKKWLSSKIML